MNIIEEVIRHVNQTRNGETDYKVFYRREASGDYPHEFLFFIKPEITSIRSEASLKQLVGTLPEKINAYGLHIQDARVLSASYLKEYNIIAQHYGVINKLSNDAKGNLSALAAEKFHAAFGASAASVKLLGSLEFLRHYPQFDPASLDALWQESQAVKLGPGTYCTEVHPDKETVYLVNGFHPRQLAHYTQPGGCIIAFTLAGQLTWKIARNAFIGLTNPTEAEPGSLRHELYQNRAEYGLETVSSSLNGFHLSAGPLEGLVELIRYNSDRGKSDMRRTGDFAFGRALLQHFNSQQIDRLVNNKTLIHDGKEISAFDLTEEKDSAEALQLLQTCLKG